MRSTLPILAVLIGLVLAGISQVPLSAQTADDESVRFGLVGRIESERRDMTVSNSPHNASMEGRAVATGGGGAARFPLLMNGRLGLLTRLLYSQDRHSWSSNGLGYAVSDPNSGSIYVSTSDRFDFTSESIQLELLPDIRLVDRLHLRIGPMIEYRYAPSSRLPEDVVLLVGDETFETLLYDPSASINFLSDGVSVFIHNDDMVDTIAIPGDTFVPTGPGFDISGVGALSYEIPITDDLLLVPELSLRLGMGPLFDATDESGLRFGLGLSLMKIVHGEDDERHVEDDEATGLGHLPALIPAPEPVVDPPLTESSPRLHSVSFDVPALPAIILRGIGPDGAQLHYARIGIYETWLYDPDHDEWHESSEIEQPALFVDPTFPEWADSWTIRFRYGDSVIAEATDRNRSDLARIDWTLASSNEKPRPIQVELTAVDSTGAAVTAIDRIETVLHRSRRLLAAEGTRTLYSLYLAETDSDAAAERNREVVREIVVEAGEGGRIALVVPAGEAMDSEAIRMLREEARELFDGSIAIETASAEERTFAFGRDFPEGVDPKRCLLFVVSRGL